MTFLVHVVLPVRFLMSIFLSIGIIPGLQLGGDGSAIRVYNIGQLSRKSIPIPALSAGTEK